MAVSFIRLFYELQILSREKCTVVAIISSLINCLYSAEKTRLDFDEKLHKLVENLHELQEELQQTKKRAKTQICPSNMSTGCEIEEKTYSSNSTDIEVRIIRLCVSFLSVFLICFAKILAQVSLIIFSYSQSNRSFFILK